MKLCYLANVRFPSERAHGAQIAHMCQAFLNNDVEVDLIVNKRVDYTPEQVTKELGFLPNFNIIRIPPSFFSARFRIAFYLSELVFAFNFYLRFKKKEYDFIYSRSEWVLWFLSFAYSTKKLIWESHEAKLTLPARRILKKGIKTVVISEGIRDEYINWDVPVKQMLVAHDGIDESFFGNVEEKEIARKRLNLPLDNKIVMYIGGFDGWKGVETFCASAQLYQEATFVAIGGREDQVADFRKKYPTVTFLGVLPYNKLKDNQQAADVLVIPNSKKEKISSHFTSPLKLFAHMASGVPIIASRIPSLSVVLGDDGATFFEPDNSASLAKSLSEVLNDFDNKLLRSKQLKSSSLKYTWTERASLIKSFIS